MLALHEDVDLSALTVQQLRYVVALDRHRSFHEAARACSVTQPALSAQVKKVESVLGLSIFDRSRQPVAVTARGSEVVEQARVVMTQIDRLGVIARRRDVLAGPYRLAVISSLASTVLPIFVPPFIAAHPEVELEIVELKTEDVLRRLREGSLDAGLAVTPLEVPALQERVLHHERLLLYLPPGHALLERARIKQSLIMDEQIWLLREGHCLRTQVLHLCHADRGRRGAQRHRVEFEGESMETLWRLVDAGCGLTVLPEMVAQRLPTAEQRGRLRPFAMPEPTRQISLVVRRDAPRAELTDAVFDALSQALPAEPAEPRLARGRVPVVLPRRAAR